MLNGLDGLTNPRLGNKNIASKADITIFLFMNLPFHSFARLLFIIHQKESTAIEAAERFALPACGRAWTRLEMWKKPKAGKMLENVADSHTSGARCVGRILSGNFPIGRRLYHFAKSSSNNNRNTYHEKNSAISFQTSISRLQLLSMIST